MENIWGLGCIYLGNYGGESKITMYACLIGMVVTWGYMLWSR
jgi:hypothetical protein